MKRKVHLAIPWFMALFLFLSFNSLGQETVIYTTGFEASEGFTAGTVYNNVEIKYDGPAGQQWGSYYGTASTTSPLTGTQSMQMRWYATAPGNLGYAYTAFDLANVTKVVFQAASTLLLNVNVSYSIDGGITFIGDEIFTLTGIAQEYTYEISETGEYSSVRLKFLISLPDPIPTGTARLYLDDVNVFGIPSGTPQVATPTFTPAGGTFYSPVQVGIASLTEDATIYYTTDGSDPDVTSTLYSGPVTVSATTTVKAIGVKDGHDNSNIGSATFTFPPIVEVANIAALRDGLTNGTVYKLTGQAVLTYQTTVRNAKYIQDASAAILIDDPTGKITTSYNLYDGITGIIGTLGAFNNMLQFTPVANPGPASSVNNTVNPVVKTLDAITDADQGKLLRINQASFTGTGNFASGQNYPITDPSGSGVVRTQYNTLDYIGSPIPDKPQQITGVMLQYQSTHQLIPRSQADMVTEPYSPLFQFTAAAANLPTWFGANRGIASSGNNIYVAKQSPVSVYVLNRLTGLETGTLNTTGMAGGQWAINDIEVSDDGYIFAANGIINNTQGNFKVYQVSSDPVVAPTLVIDFDVTSYSAIRIGDKITVAGNVADGTATLYAADGSENRVFKWMATGVDNGIVTFGAPEIVPVTQRGASNAVAPLPNGNFYHTGAGINVNKYSATGTLLGSIPGGIVPTGTTAMKYLGKDGNDEMLAIYHYGAADGYLRVVRIPYGIPANAVLEFRTPVLGTSNSTGNGDVAFEPNADGVNVDLYVLDTSDGFGGYKSNKLNLQFPDYSQAGGPVFAFTPTSRNFGSVILETTTPAQTFTISNTGTGTITIDPADITLSGPDAAEFVFSNIAETVVLGQNQSATFTVAFAPVSAGAKTATIEIDDNLGKGIHQIPLSGIGVDPTLYPPFTQDFNTTPFPPEFWTRFTGTLGETTTMTPTTTGWLHHVFGNVAGTNNSAYINIYGSRNHWLVTPPIQLGDGSTDYRLTVDIALTPWTGTAQSTLGATDYVAVVISTDNGVTWSNANVLIDWDASDVISPTGNHIVLTLADYSGSVKIGFYAYRPTGNTPDLRFYVDNVTVEEIPENPVFSLNPTSWDFGTVEVDVLSPAKEFVISNAGPGVLIVNAPVLDNTDDFILTYTAEDFPAELASFETVTFSVVFAPDATGPFAGEISIGYNDGADNTATIALTGNGYTRPAGSTCANPLVVTLPVVNYQDNTQAYGNDYLSAWVNPSTSYLNGYDFVAQFTLTEPGYLSGSVAGSWTGVIIVQDCPDPVTPAARLALGSGSTGGAFTNVYLQAGTYFAIVSTFPTPNYTDFTLNLSFNPGYTVTFVVEDEDAAPITDAIITLGSVTNPAGNYVFENKLPGTYAYTVASEGYFNATGEIIVVDADVTETVVMEALPTVPVIVSITPVPNVSVAYGTLEADAIAALAPTTTVTDSNSDTYTVVLSWTIASYDGEVAGAYTATGTFSMPEGVEQPDPPLALAVTATVTVLEPPVVIDAFPWLEDFEQDDFPPNGWAGHNVDDGGTQWVLSTVQNHTPGGTRSAFHNYALASAGNQNGWLVTPLLQLPDENMRLRFWSYNTFPTYYGNNSVLISTGSSDPLSEDFVQVWTTTAVTASWVETIVDLSEYSSEEIYIAFRYQGLDAHGWYLDDVLVELAPQPLARMQIIHNSADAAVDEVDIYVNGDLFLSDFAFRTATPFVNVPAGVDLDIIVAPAGAGIANGVGPVTVNLTEGETYIAIANGIVSATGYDPATAFSLDVFAAGREAATVATNTDVLVFHGSTDAPTVSVWETGVGAGELFTFSYGEFEGYLELGTADYVLEVRTADGTTVVAAYEAPLATLGLDGAAITVVASGFLDPANNSNGAAFGLYVALASGGNLIALPVYIETFEVTFNVNMTFAEGFDPATDVVYLTGSILGWAEPGTDPDHQTMTRVDDSMIWTKTLQLEAGNYAYKYFLNAGWGGGEWQGGDDRVLEVEDDMEVNDWFGSLTDPTTIIDPSLAQIRIFPVPARTTLYISSPEVIRDLRIIDMLGQVAYNANVAGLSHEVNVGGFKDGIYFIQILTSKGIETRRIQVQK